VGDDLDLDRKRRRFQMEAIGFRAVAALVVP
jgi:hypothetical protein